MCRQLGTKYEGLFDVSRIRVRLGHDTIVIGLVLDRTDSCIVIIGPYFSILAQDALVHVHRLLLEDR